MNYNNIEICVLIKGRPITEYAHNGQVFVEGRAGSEFELEVKNHNYHRVEVILSVDGLSITDGKDAGPNSTGYLIDGRGSIRIPGWKLNEGQVAAFEFTGKGKSYAQAATGLNHNTGVIGLLAFSEKVKAQSWNPPIFALNGTAMPGAAMTGAVYNSRGISTCWSMGDSMSLSIGDSMSMGSAMAMNAIAPDQEEHTSGGVLRSSKAASSAVVPETPVVQNLGTGFGSATEFNTTTVTFDRGDLLATIVLYYDDQTGLKKRGIVFDRVPKNRDTQTPNAFPGMSGCVPPAGWNG